MGNHCEVNKKINISQFQEIVIISQGILWENTG